ncbi:protein of unknown function DUF115 [Ferroglobus placidus DSM 10642]|uniref:6-hydroxymethyl-7,8-dihydropterin pyrophosphokinase n=1 Tax=Ferroglobus placidus (strain DSM 10642 / AEDII12DO) TaxID=589924 RepID=D3RZ44_FERPA|nr:6-hydroxymethylpterin diphosphokinase MptE-like protein [Ferroglobus placidus]ADC65757.1 protein of unknown function DUF115 [Ferroglobus placidus DSM 10642]
MKLEEWFKIYIEIARDFGYSIDEDRRAAIILKEMGNGKLLDKEVLREKIEGKEVVVVGGAVEKPIESQTIITAGKSLIKWMKITSRVPDVHVTDLEEGAEILKKVEEKGCVLVIHAHGDNVELIKEIVPELNSFVATTQAEPFDRVYNFGGFTDGDRAAIIAKEFGARKILLHGFEFKAEGVKGKKLVWAKKILELEGII